MKKKTDPDVGPDAILVMIPTDLDYLLETTRDRDGTVFDMGYFRLHRFRRKREESFSIIGPFLGAPHAVMGLEKIIALGARRIWALGWCGSLQPDLRIGDLVIPTDSVCEEGTSSHYPIGPEGPRTDRELNAVLAAALSKGDKPFQKGTVWTTDAPFRETPTKVLAYRNREVLGVEMEMSALMTVSIYRSAKLAGLLVVSDELFDLRWKPGFKNPRFKEGCRAAARLLLGLADSPPMSFTDQGSGARREETYTPSL
ncbi:MAG: nucleoside phosphorylase [Deltaproteobacteria bacterium]|nr:nucleoside phosphorylase [Deltaproteobacteria bacterium]